MIFAPKTITLKDGREAIFRSPELSDCPALINYLLTTATETDFLMSDPRESGRWEGEEGLRREEEIIGDNISSPDKLMICCFVDGELAGNCFIGYNTRVKTAHRATVGVGLIKKYWGLGIGTAMFNELIQNAYERGGIMQIELDYLEGNTRALGLYEKMGFKEVAHRPNAVKLADGRLLDEISMVKVL